MTGNSRHALIVTAHFPPDRGPATHRVLRFARHLRSAGWDVTVLTITESAYRQGTPIDMALLDRVPPGVRVVRTTVRRPVERLAAWRARWRKRTSPGAGASRDGRATARPVHEAGGVPPREGFADLLTGVFSLPDRDVGWYGPAISAGRRILRSAPVDIIVSTAPPFTTHLIARRLSRLGRVPWIADFRDPWSRAPWALVERTTSWRGWVHRTLERRVVRDADRVVLNTGRMRDDFAAHYADLASSHFEALPNGYDRDVLQAVAGVAPAAAGPARLTHAGTLYGARDPTVLFSALRQLAESGRLAASPLHVHLLGSVSGGFAARGQVEALGLGDVVSFQKPVPHAEALRLLGASHALLLFQQGTDLQVPAKLYEYVGLRRPIIAVAPRPSAVADVVEGTGLGVVIRPDDVAGLADALERVAAREPLATPDDDAIAGFDGDRLGRRFVALAEAACREP